MQRLPAASSVIAAAVLTPFASSLGELREVVSAACAAPPEIDATRRARLDSALAGIAPKQRKLMSRSAELSVALVHRLVLDGATLSPPLDWAAMGLFAGVGASDARLDDFARLVHASVDAGALSYTKLGSTGLAACHPLFAFRIMNNFTLAHPAIAEGIRGPNAAYFSRGSATTQALVDAAWAVHEGECPHAIVLGADTANHPLTLAEARREGAPIPDPSEAAAAWILGPARDPRAIATLHAVGTRPADRGSGTSVTSVTSVVEWVVAEGAADQAFVVVVDAPASRARLLAELRTRSSHVVDLVGICGTTLAAGPMVGVCVGLGMLEANARVPGVTVVTLDADGSASFVRLGPTEAA